MSDHLPDSALPGQAGGAQDLDGHETGRLEALDLHRVDGSGHWDDQTVRVDALLGGVVAELFPELASKFNALGISHVYNFVQYHLVYIKRALISRGGWPEGHYTALPLDKILIMVEQVLKHYTDKIQ